MDITKVPYTNGIDQEIKGYVDLTDLMKEVAEQSEKDFKNWKDKNNSNLKI